jgi:hypothetical protein
MKQIRRCSLVHSFAFLVGVGALTACSDALAPTPVSPLATVKTPDDLFVMLPGPTGYRLSASFSVTNTTDRTIYSRLGCNFVVQRADGGTWRDVLAPVCDAVKSGLSILPPGQSVFALSGLDLFSSDPKASLIPAGTYRIHVSLYFDRDGLEPLPADAGYSRPVYVDSGSHVTVYPP